MPLVPEGPFTPKPTGPDPQVSQVAVGLGGGGVAADYNALFAQLPALEWKEIQLPYSSFTWEIRHDLAIHKLFDRDGAYIEGTGRNPVEFTARVPLLNGLDAGPNERWQRPLFPFTSDALVRVAMDKSSGVLVTPRFGPVTCKLQHLRGVLDANVRSGEWVDVSWSETDDSASSDISQDLSNPSPLANAQAAANDLTFQMTEVDPNVIPNLYVPPVSFDDMMNAIRGVVDTPTLLQKQYAGQVANMIYEANALEASANASANALNWPLIQSAERVKAAAYALQGSLLKKTKTVVFYTVGADCTLASLSAQASAPIGDLMQLNPGLCANPLVSAGTVLRKYA